MKLFRIFTLVFCILIFAAPLLAEERIVGAGLINEGAKVEDIAPVIMGLPIDQGEVNLFLGALENIERWANKNTRAWNEVDSAEDTLAAIRALGVWKTAGINAEEYFTLLTKLLTAKQIHSGKLDAEKYKEFIKNYESYKEGASEDRKKELNKSITRLNQMIGAIENYPAGSLEVYKANKDAIDTAFALLNSLSLRSMINEGNRERVKELISMGADVNSPNKYGSTPLISASWKGDKEIVRTLIEAGADVDARNQSGGTALMGAVSKGTKEIVEMLLQSGADVNAKDENGGTALQSASWKGNKEIVGILIEAGAVVNARGKYDSTAIGSAVSQGHTEVVELLIKAGADVNERNSRGATMLITAIDIGKKERAKMLLSLGADINVRDKRGRTALARACDFGTREKIEYLIELGADVNVKNNYGNTPLHMVITNTEKDKEVVKLLLNAGAYINTRDKYGYTALMRAAEKIGGDMEIAKLLIKAGANLNVTDTNGLTVLMQAVMAKHKEMVEVLLSTGADVNFRGGKGMVALGYVGRHERYNAKAKEIADLLRAYGAR